MTETLAAWFPAGIDQVNVPSPDVSWSFGAPTMDSLRRRAFMNAYVSAAVILVVTVSDPWSIVVVGGASHSQ